jgi:flagellum-specific ATP synthase
MNTTITQNLLENVETNLKPKAIRLTGRVSKYDGNLLECDGFPANIGAICEVETDLGTMEKAEIVGFNDGNNCLSLFQSGAQIKSGSRVSLLDDGYSIPVGTNLLGRVIDALGKPLDGDPNPLLRKNWPLNGVQLNPLLRNPVSKPLDVGIRGINGLLTVGQGQRIGIIAGSGVGKSVLLGMMSKNTNADVIVVALIGERGREVGKFVNDILTSEAKTRTVVVAVPADRSPLLRIRGANRATAIAEFFRDCGKNVLLIMDSLTRVAHARREIGLALGEQPTAKGYPPSVVSLIPKLVERSGTGIGRQGSVTAFYTVLADGDDTNDPVVDTARAILDGHILLSREQTQLGIYPALDIPNSVSRVMTEITSVAHQEAANKFRRLVSLYMENRDLILMGGYSVGQDPDLDEAVNLWPNLVSYLRQEQNVKADMKSATVDLEKVISGDSNAI